MAKAKRYSKKQIINVLNKYEADARTLIRNKEILIEYLDKIEEYISDNGVKYDKLTGLKTLLSLVRDEIEQAYTETSPECVISTLSAILCIINNLQLDNDALSEKESIPNDVAIRFIRNGFKDEIEEYKFWRKWKKTGEYPVVPLSIIDSKEEKEITDLDKRYDKLP